MHFDDRLGTVLRQPVSGEAVARIQYVQLLDLLGTVHDDGDGDESEVRLDPAYERLLELSFRLSAAERADLLHRSGLRLRNPRLLCFLAEDDHQVSAAAIAAADLKQDEWLDLIPALPIVSRGILRHRRDLGPAVEERLEQLGIADRALPPATHVVAAQSDISAEIVPIRKPCPTTSDTGIGEIVRKIEAYRKEHPARQHPSPSDTPRLPLGDGESAPARPAVESFDFVTDAAGSIMEADAHAASMLIGLSLATLDSQPSDARSLSLARAIALRQPIERCIVTIQLAEPVSGEWQIDAAPLFNEITAQFGGYAGRARRVRIGPTPVPAPAHNADRMRQMLHELRNPAGAIQMSSELIQQQLGGNVPHEYRAIAASIASDTALVLAGFEELDRLVKLDTHAMRVEAGTTDIVAALAKTVTQIHRHTEPRQSGFTLQTPQSDIVVAVERTELDRLLWRLLAAIAGASAAMEMLDLTLTQDATMARLAVSLPESLRDLDEDQLYQAQAGDRSRVLSAGMFGLGFTLRLARAEAGAAGGVLRREGDQLLLTLPESQPASANLSEA